MNKEEMVAVLEDHLFVSDEWGGSKLANWKWGYNVVVDGIEDAVDDLIQQLENEPDDKPQCSCHHVEISPNICVIKCLNCGRISFQ